MNDPNLGAADVISFGCQSCGMQLEVPKSRGGHAVKCPACEQVQPAPSSEQNLADSAAVAVQSDRRAATASSTLPAQDQSGSAGNSPTVSTSLQLSAIDALSAGQATPTKVLFDRITKEVSKLYVGQDELVIGTLIALFSSGHVLIESVPGLGKTLFVRTMGRILGMPFGRIQFTADLMPSDITGAPIFDMKTQEFRFRPGPVFTQLLLADEINRSPAKTHAALLEIMQEYRVTIDGTSHVLDRPFLVLATQNPVESEGTYNLPEAQLDRFMFKLVASYPEESDEAEILRLHSQQVDINQRLEEEIQEVTSPEEILQITRDNANVLIDEKLIGYINEIVRRTRGWPGFHLGASPRGRDRTHAGRANIGRVLRTRLCRPRRRCPNHFSGPTTPRDPLRRGRSGRSRR